MKTSITFIFSFLLMVNVKAQSGWLINQNGKPIAFASIGVEGKNIGTYSFEDGYFELNPSVEDSITIRHIAYETIKIRLTKNGQKIRLKEKEVILEEVVITPQETLRYGLFKNKSSSSISVDLPFNGSEVGTIVRLSGAPVIIQQLFVNVARQHVSEVRLRGNIYSLSSDMPDSLIYQTGPTNIGAQNGIVEIPIDKSLTVNGDIFLSFEWLVEKKVADEIKLGYRDKKHLVDEIRLQHQGSINIYNHKRVEVLDENGLLKKEIRLNKHQTRQLKVIESNIPKLLFKTNQKGEATYYRSHSLGTWYPYPQSLIAGIEVFKLKQE